jgi:hypothetical protein
VLSRAVTVEGSVAKVVHLYKVSTAEVKDAVAFEKRLAA